MTYLIRDVTKRHLILVPNASALVPDASANFAADPHQSDCEFELKVVNASDHFASFQVELSIQGMNSNGGTKWYSVEPHICAKKPPGDTTQFRIVITKAPIPSYDTTIPILVKVFSVESDRISDTQTVELTIKKPESPLKVYLPIKDLKVYPGDRLNIPVLVYNLRPQFTQVTLTLEDLDPRWFVQQEVRKTISLEASASQEVIFHCSPPKDTQIESRIYEFSVRAEDQSRNIIHGSGHVEVLSFGVVKFHCAQPSQTIPDRNGSAHPNAGGAEYPFQFTNCSNVKHLIALSLMQSGHPRPETILPPLEVEPGGTVQTARLIREDRPWLGWARHWRFEALPTLTNARSGEPSDPVYVEPTIQTLDLVVRPRIPLWLQILIPLLGLLGVGLWGWLTPPRSPHQAPVNSVRIMNDETTVISGSSDRTVLRWDVSPIPWIANHRRLSYRGVIAGAIETERAVRVIREMPRREGQIAVGTENGKIQLWQVSSIQNQSFTTLYDGSDRVFDLDFTPDSRYLFSGHGSGMVRQWDLETNRETARQYYFQDAISALSVIPSEPGQLSRPWVAIAGQYDKFALWNWAESQVYEINVEWNDAPSSNSSTPTIQPVIGKYSYINTLSAAADVPLLAMADNRGYIMLWTVNALKQCIEEQSTRVPSVERSGNFLYAMDCQQAQQKRWQAGYRGQSIRSIALSHDGCYLASVGDDGRVLLWLLEDLERRSPDSPNFILLDHFPGTPLRTVDIEHPEPGYVLVAADAPDNRVKLYRQSVDPSLCPPDAQREF